MATPSASYFPLTGDSAVDAITNGSYWSLGADRTIYWSISDGFFSEFWPDPGFVAQHVNYALATIYSYYANVKFVYTGYYANPISAHQAGSDINISLDGAFAFFSNTNQWAIGFFPNITWEAKYQGAAGDIFLNINSPASSLPSYEPGSEGWTLLLHELGHTLGLKHTHDGGGTGRPTLPQLGLGQFDIDWVSIMTYEDNFESNLIQFDPATPQILDVIGLQYLYGINWSTNVGNSTYALSTNNPFYYTVWDAGGIDKVDASGSTTGWLIQLPNLQLSTLVTQKFGFATPLADYAVWASTGLSPLTLTWLEGDIENAIGSSFADEIHGSDLANVLTGGLGNDYLDGGIGFDVAVLSSFKNQYTINQQSTSQYLVTGPDGADTVANVEALQFLDTTVLLDANGAIDLEATVQSVYQAMTSVLPADSTLSNLISFSTAQYAWGLSVGVLDPVAAMGEALGLGLCESAGFFISSFGPAALQNDATFVSKAYEQAFGLLPSQAQTTHFLDQLHYFDSFYTAAATYGTDPARIDLLARGAVYGQMLGISAELDLLV